ncbi:putative hydrolase [Microbulbifer aggregans]|uniref:Putative hydrolase n=1 Tax=Microbulbifer aggregans TaxID=1769779 RepID=A0A1C9W9S6_9GAMM|nr:cysteine hydrolase [Microbulbifer aggregans]AOS97875.1 putative hydrolase [Microbulbifer aggregans]
MKSALLCIDLQHLCAVRGEGIFSEGQSCPFSPEEQNYFFDRLEKQVLPNVQKLQAIFRDKGIEVLHIRTRTKTRDGRERTFWQKRAGLLATPGSRESEFIDSVMPRGDELIVNKTGSGPFGNTNLHALLVQLDVQQLYCCGVHTNTSIESTIRAAADYGYCPVLIPDATAAASQALQDNCVERLVGQCCEEIETNKLVEDFKHHLRSVG